MIATILAWIGGFSVLFTMVLIAAAIRLNWLAKRKEESRHADVDTLARRAKALSARSTRVERWHDLPTADEMGI
jgi:hypothetical protein